MPQDYPITQAVRALRAAKVDFIPYLYPYVERGGTRASSESFGVDEHFVIKTIVLEAKDDRPRPLIVLMHGDREISPSILTALLRATPVSVAA